MEEIAGVLFHGRNSLMSSFKFVLGEEMREDKAVLRKLDNWDF